MLDHKDESLPAVDRWTVRCYQRAVPPDVGQPRLLNNAHGVFMISVRLPTDCETRVLAPGATAHHRRPQKATPAVRLLEANSVIGDTTSTTRQTGRAVIGQAGAAVATGVADDTVSHCTHSAAAGSPSDHSDPRWLRWGASTPGLEGRPGDRGPVSLGRRECSGDEQPVGPFPHRPHLGAGQVLSKRGAQRSVQLRTHPA